MTVQAGCSQRPQMSLVLVSAVLLILMEYNTTLWGLAYPLGLAHAPRGCSFSKASQPSPSQRGPSASDQPPKQVQDRTAGRLGSGEQTTFLDLSTPDIWGQIIPVG